ncbi:MAG TPA: diaminopimelate epimerase [Pyrinomonadaceae bacterium]|nr:diaminopimelate epimerase [Pyrinomonadaceae bacterium]
MPPQFTKFHGLGNDYLVIEVEQLAGIDDLGDFAKRICNRHYGAGGDGIAVIGRVTGKSDNAGADFTCRIFNPDGSEAGLSGNGTRCAVAYLHYRGLWTKEELRLSTRTGLKRYFLRGQPGPGKYLFESELGQPKFDSRSIPMSIDPPLERVINYPFETFQITAMQMGNPNCCIFVDDFNALDWRRIGKHIENHPTFTDRTNVVFVRVVDRKLIELRIWERGVGETTASGTCSCAGAVAAMVNEKTDRDIRVVMEGGEVRINWRDDDQVVITGTAEVVYSGQWLGH